MRRAIFLKLIQVVVVALILNSAIFYLAASSALLKNTRKDMLYTLKAIDRILDHTGDMNEQVRRLETVVNENGSRFTIIRGDGLVMADTGVMDISSMDNHLQREEIKDAMERGSGYSRRYSGTLKKDMLYAAIRSDGNGSILRLAVPYEGMREYLIMLLPAVWLSFLAALLWSAFSADQFSLSVTRPLKEISQAMEGVNGDYTELSFDAYQYPEINVIAQTTTSMSRNVKEYLTQINLEKQIRQEFFSNASHELKTPITSIQGYSELLENDIVQDEAQKKEFIRRIKKEAVHMTSLINDILMISRLEARDPTAEKEPVHMDTVLKEVLESLKPLAASREVLIEAQCDPVCIQADMRQMRELLGNLISNAVKYNKPGGSVWVTITTKDQFMVIKVKDNGMGIPQESLGRIFERFYRVDKGRSRKQGGTGLGLSIVKHIAGYYHGVVSVHSVLEEGTEFTVEIPI